MNRLCRSWFSCWSWFSRRSSKVNRFYMCRFSRRSSKVNRLYRYWFSCWSWFSRRGSKVNRLSRCWFRSRLSNLLSYWFSSSLNGCWFHSYKSRFFSRCFFYQRLLKRLQLFESYINIEDVFLFINKISNLSQGISHTLL